MGDADAGDFGVFVSAQVERIAAALGHNVLHHHVAHAGRERAAGAFLVIEIDVDYAARHFADRVVAEVEILQVAATVRVGLDAQGAVEVRAVHAVVFHVHIAYAARNFAADGYATVAVFHAAIPHHDVFAGDVDAASVAIAAALDGDAIVAGIEFATIDQHVGRALRIAAIVVGTVAGDLDVAHGDIPAQHGIEFPHRRIADGDAFEQNVGRAVWLHEIGPQRGPIAVDALAHRHVFFALREQGAVVGGRRLRAAHGIFLPRPPVVRVRAAIERPVSGDGDVGLFEGVNEGRVVHALGAFEAGEDHRQIVVRILAKPQRCAVFQAQVDVAGQMDRASEEDAGRDHDPAAAGGGTGLDSVADGNGRFDLSALASAETSDFERAVRELGRADAGQNLFQLASGVGGRLGQEPEARRRQRGGASQESAACHGFSDPL